VWEAVAPDLITLERRIHFVDEVDFNAGPIHAQFIDLCLVDRNAPPLLPR
jgi:hypothetical protein